MTGPSLFYLLLTAVTEYNTLQQGIPRDYELTHAYVVRAPATDLKGHAGPVVAADWLLSGTEVASAACDNTVRVWSAETGVQVCPMCQCLSRMSMRVSVKNVAFAMHSYGYAFADMGCACFVQLSQLTGGFEDQHYVNNLTVSSAPTSSLVLLAVSDGSWRVLDPKLPKNQYVITTPPHALTRTH